MDPDEDFEKLDVSERLVHKLWKARVSAYEELSRTFQGTDSEDDHSLRTYSADTSILQAASVDSNAIAQERAMAMIHDFVCAASSDASNRLVPALLDSKPSLIDKGLGSSRAGTKSKSTDILIAMAQALGSTDSLISRLLASVPNFSKQPKVLSGLVLTLTRLVQSFGLRSDTCSDPRAVLQSLPTFFAHADKNVRLEANNLIDAIYVFMGEAPLSATLSALKPVQASEIKQRWQDLENDGKGKGSVSPEKLTRAQQRKKDVLEAQGQLEGAGTDDNGQNDDDGDEQPEAGAQDDFEEHDPYDLCEPIKLAAIIPDDFDANVVSTKWKERKELALEPVYNNLAPSQAVIRIEPQNTADVDRIVTNVAQRIQVDANILCVTLSAQIVSRLAIGLRAGFAKHAHTLLPPLIEKLKERKPSVVECLANALYEIFKSVQYDNMRSNTSPLSVILPFCIPALSHKNPNVKSETINYISRILSNLETAPKMNESEDTKKLPASLKSCLEDGAEIVRNSAVIALATLRKLLNASEAESLLKGVEDARVTRIKEADANVTVKAKKATSKPAAPTAAPKVIQPASKPVSSAPTGQTKKAATVSKPSTPKPTSDAPKPAAVKPATSKQAAPAKPTVATKKPGASAAAKALPNGSSDPGESIKYKYSTAAEANEEAKRVLPADAVEELTSSNWKARLAAMDSLADFLGVTAAESENLPGAASGASVENSGAIAEYDSEMIVRFLGTTPGWKESNFQVFGKSLAILRRLAMASPSFQKASVALASPPLADKLGDMKLKKPAGDTLTAFSERTSFGLVLSLICTPVANQKAPKAQAEALTWVEHALQEFGVSGVPIKDLISLLKTCLKSSNAMVRTSATKALVALKVFIGPDVKDFLSDLNPTLLSTIDKEFSAVDGQSAPEPIRSSALESEKKSTSKVGQKDADPMEELFTRYELEKIVPNSLIAASGDPAWKTRKEAMEKLQSILEEHKRFKPGMGDLTRVLKARLGDSNKIVQGLALDAITRIASGMNKPFEKHVKTLTPALLSVLSDQKAPIRASAISSLSAVTDAVGLEVLTSSFETGLSQANPLQRKELLDWLTERFQDAPSVAETYPKLDLSALISPVLSCLEDRNGEVRKAAQSFLPSFIAFAGYNSIMDEVSNLKPASKSSITPLLEAARSSVPKISSSSGAHKRAPSETAAIPSAAQSRPGSAASSSTATRTESPSTNASKNPPGTNLAMKKPPRVGSKQLPVLPTESVSAPSSSSATGTGVPRPKTGISTGVRPPGAGSARNQTSAMPAPSSPDLQKKEMPLRTNDSKAKQSRANKEVGKVKWIIADGVVRQDQIEYLHQQIGPHVSAEFLHLLFSKDHHAERDHMAALDILLSCCNDSKEALIESYGPEGEDMGRRIIENLDFLLKYLTIRLAENSTTLLVKTTETTEAILTSLLNQGYRLTDHEASCLLPSLIHKNGDAKDAIRAKIKAIFKALGGLYPNSRVFSSLVEYGLKSKNSRTRAESATDLSNLIQRMGMSVCTQPNKALPVVAGLIEDRDSNVRAAALNVLANVHGLVGEEVFQYTGDVPEKSLSMLNERIRRTGGRTSPAPTSPPRASVSSPRSGIPRTGANRNSATSGIPAPGAASRIAAPATSGLKRPTSIVPSTKAAEGSESPQLKSVKPLQIKARGGGDESSHNQRSNVASTSNAGTDSNTEVLIKNLVTDDPTASVEALKTIQKELLQDSQPLLLQANDLIHSVIAQMKYSFEDLQVDSSPAMMRLCKHLLQTLSTFFDKKEQGVEVSRETLTDLLAELSHRLLDTADRTDNETISGISKVLNMVLIRIFHHSDQASCFGSLFSLLHQVTVDMRELEGDELSGRARYAELIMKCLWKVSKTVKQSIDDHSLDARVLLHDIDDFLTSIPPAEWRRRATDSVPLGDMPLRTVKTILQQVVSVYHTDVYDKLELVERPENSFVYQYLYRLLNNSSSRAPSHLPQEQQKSENRQSNDSSNNPSRQNNLDGTSRERQTSASKFADPDGEGRQTPGSSIEDDNRKSDSHMTSPVGGALSSEIEINQKLKEIFDQIGNPRESKSGISELYKFQKQHPTAEGKINNWISGTGNYFQSYIKRGLVNLANEDADRHSVVMDSPRPVGRAETPLSPTSRKDVAASGITSPANDSNALRNQSADIRRSRHTSAADKEGGVEESQKLTQLQAMFGYTDKHNSLTSPENGT